MMMPSEQIGGVGLLSFVSVLSPLFFLFRGFAIFSSLDLIYLLRFGSLFLCLSVNKVRLRKTTSSSRRRLAQFSLKEEEEEEEGVLPDPIPFFFRVVPSNRLPHFVFSSSLMFADTHTQAVSQSNTIEF